MAGVVTLTSGKLNKAQSWRSVETMTASTATTPQAISVETDTTILGGSTVTRGVLNNLYTLAAGVQGQEKLIMHATATGRSAVIFSYPNQRMPIFDGANMGTVTDAELHWVSGTGQIILEADGDYLLLRFIGSDWQIMSMAGATLATST